MILTFISEMEVPRPSLQRKVSRLSISELTSACVVSQVLVINTGGTIGMKNSVDGYIPVKGFLEDVVRSLPILNDTRFLDPDIHGTGCITPVLNMESGIKRRIYYEFLEYDPLLDSSNMDMQDWGYIAATVKENYTRYDGFLIVHGTDTMTYTASALSFMLENLGKPVIITGAQLPLESMNSDGISNFSGALTVAGCFVIPEVCIFFCDKLFRGNRTVKTTAFGFDAFESPNLPALLELGTGVVERKDLYYRPVEISRMSVHAPLDPNVCIVRFFPGITDDTLRAFTQPPMKGVVLQTYGAGNAPDNRIALLAILKAASDRGVLLVNCTQCQHGNVTTAYRTGKMLWDAGVIPGGDMTPECALTKLSYIITKTELSLEQKRKLISKSLRGEMTVEVEPSLNLRDVEFIENVARVMGAREEYDQIREALEPVLLCSAARDGDLKWLEKMKMEGFDFNETDYDDRTPLHLASGEGKRAAVELLLRNGARVHAKDRFGWTPLRDAVEGRHIDVVEILVQAGAQLGLPDAELCFLLTRTMLTHGLGTLKLWLKAGANVNAEDLNGQTVLHHAARRGDQEAVKLLIAYGADVTALDCRKETPLDVALVFQHTGCANLMEMSQPAHQSSTRTNSNSPELRSHLHRLAERQRTDSAPSLLFDI